MAQFKIVDKKVQMSQEQIIKFQLITYCYLNKISISESDLACLTLLALNEKAELSDFCNACCLSEFRDKDTSLTYTKVIFKTPQTVRNCLTKMVNYNIITKEGLGHGKLIELNPEIKLQAKGNVLLNYKMFSIGTEESQGV
jgi:hypothetical protein